MHLPGGRWAHNAELGIGRRRYVTNEDRTLRIAPEALAAVRSPWLRLVVELQESPGEAAGGGAWHALDGRFPAKFRFRARQRPVSDGGRAANPLGQRCFRAAGRVNPLFGRLSAGGTRRVKDGAGRESRPP